MVADYTLRSELIAESVRLNAEIRTLRAALDEANTERERLAKDNERFSEAWGQVVQREQRTDNAHDYDMRQVEAERDRAVAQVEAVKALCTYWEKLAPGDRYYAGRVRAHLAGQDNGDSE